MLLFVLEVVLVWGFEYKMGGVWAKCTKIGKVVFGTGYIMRSVSELFFVVIRGLSKVSKSVCNFVDDEARDYS